MYRLKTKLDRAIIFPKKYERIEIEKYESG